ACNLFTSPTSTRYILSTRTCLPSPPPSSSPSDKPPSPPTPNRTITTALLIESLLSKDKSVRQTGAALAFNVAVVEAKRRERVGDEKEEEEDEDELLHEEWLCEVLAAVVKALESEHGGDSSSNSDGNDDSETVLRLLATTGVLVRYASQSLIDLAVALEVSDILEKLKEKGRAVKRTEGKEGKEGAKEKVERERRERIAELCGEVEEMVRKGGW
ncbi:hypothetical protein HK102_005879, partial [Quaeritorhiza haematococci]